MRSITAIGMGIVLAVFAIAEAKAERPRADGLQEDPQWRILTLRKIPAFIPQAVIAAQPLDELPVDDAERSLLRQLMRTAQPPGCEPQNQPAQQGQFDSLTVAQAVGRQKIVFIGTVTKIVPGWDAWGNDVARAVYLDVQAVLRGDWNPPVEVAIVVSGGELTIENTTICTHPAAGLHHPLPGDVLLVAGKVVEGSSGLFDDLLVLPITADEVHPVASPILAIDVQPISLTELRSRLRLEEEK